MQHNPILNIFGVHEKQGLQLILLLLEWKISQTRND